MLLALGGGVTAYTLLVGRVGSVFLAGLAMPTADGDAKPLRVRQKVRASPNRNWTVDCGYNPLQLSPLQGSVARSADEPSRGATGGPNDDVVFLCEVQVRHWRMRLTPASA